MSRALLYTLRSEHVKVDALDFSIASNAEVERQAVTTITASGLYNKSVSRSGGLHDAALGAMDRGQPCATCGKDLFLCPGHTGVIKLPVPVLHPLYTDYILKVLRSVCFFCSRPKVQGLDPEARPTTAVHGGRRRFHTVYGLCRGRKHCAHCGGPCPEWSADGNGIVRTWPAGAKFEDEEEEAFCAPPVTCVEATLEIDAIVRCISDTDAAALGFDPGLCAPRDLLLWCLLVPSPAIRPSVVTSEGSRKRGHDDITIRLQEVVKRRNDMLAGIEKGESVAALHARLQYDIGTYMISQQKVHRPPGARVGSKLKSVVCKLKGKDGRIRNNLMGDLLP